VDGWMDYHHLREENSAKLVIIYEKLMTYYELMDDVWFVEIFTSKAVILFIVVVYFLSCFNPK
jgi:hypothetical protein